ncbi:hypothetical protein OG806_38525 [Streptomyces sp. NBC_00882]|uniref:hypothetical protein n=1 Tax=Streptomyces sp. NBC_00882 TaxID=2975856 RepID=UPI0038668A97|nr:hypothetical protein OG806_38525 [Streptomyces sp. NBC_00882]
MKRQHAVEIILTRPVTRTELHRACRSVPLAANADRTRLMTVRPAKSPGRALRSLRHQLDRLLPIDVLTSHYPDRSGQVELNVAFTRPIRALIGQAATARGQKSAEFLSRTVVEAVARDERTRTRHLTARLQDLLVHHTPEAVLACAAHVLLDHQRPSSSSSRDVDDQRPSAVHTTP